MPVLSKKAKKGKGQKGSKKGAVKIVPDPDAAYKQQLDEAFYVPKPSRERINQRNISAVDAAIRASAVSAGSNAAGEPSLTSPILLARVPEIVRSLGLCATDEQMDQICCMVTQTAPAKTATGEAPPQALSPYADVERLRCVLSEMLHTHVLAYDPQVLACPDPRFPTRVSSVIYKVSERDLASCFAAIWEATGRKSITRSDGAEVRCFTVDEMEAIIAEAHVGSSSVKPLSKDELDDLYFFIKSEANDVIGEDTFLRCLGDVK